MTRAHVSKAEAIHYSEAAEAYESLVTSGEPKGDAFREAIRVLGRLVAASKPSPAVALRPRIDGEAIDGVKALVEQVARIYGAPVKVVMDMARKVPRITLARHEAWLRLSVLGYSGPDIAAFFGCNDSTVVTGKQSFREKHPVRAAEIEAGGPVRADLRSVPADERRAA